MLTFNAVANSRSGVIHMPTSPLATLLPFAEDRPPVEMIKVSANSRSTAVAGAIAGIVRDTGHAEMQAIGASAVNQAIKAIAIAHGYLQLDGIDIVCVPSFTEVEIDGQERTAVRISVEKRPA